MRRTLRGRQQIYSNLILEKTVLVLGHCDLASHLEAF